MCRGEVCYPDSLPGEDAVAVAQVAAQERLDVGLRVGAVGIVVDPCVLGVARAPPYA